MIPSKYRSLIKDSVRSASVAVTSIVMSEEEGQGTSQFPEEVLRRSDTKHRYSIVHLEDREMMVRWSFMEVLTSILKPVRMCVNQSYKKHIFEKLKVGKTPRLKEMLNISRFVQMNHFSPGASEELDHAFVTLLTETQMFRQFVARYIRLSKRNVFDAWCALKNRTIMMQYEFWKSTGVGQRFGCLQKLAKGDDGVHARGGFFGKFKGHKWRKRVFHIKNPMHMDVLLENAIHIVQPDDEYEEGHGNSDAKRDETLKELLADENAGSESDDAGYDGGEDGDETDDEITPPTKRSERITEDEKKKTSDVNRLLRNQMKAKIEKIKKCFLNSATKGIAKDELVLNWFDVEKDLKFKYISEYVTALNSFIDLESNEIYIDGLDPNLETADGEIGKLYIRVKVTGVYNTKIKDDTIDKSNFQELLSKEPRQRHYLYTEIDADGDAMTKKAAWYQVVAWKPQHSKVYTFGIEHNRIRRGDYIAICPQLSMPLVKECRLDCSDQALGTKSGMKSRKIQEWYQTNQPEFEWAVEHNEEHIGNLYADQKHVRKWTHMGFADYADAGNTFQGIRIKKNLDDDVITVFPDDMMICIHTGTKEAFESPKKYKRSRLVYVVDINYLYTSALSIYPGLIVELYAMMAENESSGADHKFKIVPGQMEILLPSSEYQSQMVEKSKTPFYFELNYNSMAKPADKLLMLTSFNNLDRREWMKALKAVNFDKTKYEAQSALYKASIDDDPAILALVSGGVTRSGAVLREAKAKYQALRIFGKVAKNKINISKESKTVLEQLEVLLRPSKLNGDQGALMWLKKLKSCGLYDDVYGDLTDTQKESTSALINGKPIPSGDGDSEGNSTETRNALVEFLMDKWDKYVETKDAGNVVRIIKALHGGDRGLKKLKESVKGELKDAGVNFKKKKK